MSSNSGYFTIQALLDDDKFKKGLKDIVGQTKKTAVKSRLHLQSISKGIKMLRSSAMRGTMAFAGLYAGVAKLTDIYHEKEASEKRHIAIMKSMGKYTKKAARENVAFARSLQQITNYSDSQILDTMGIFHTFSNIDNSLAKRATKVAADMNAVIGGTGDSMKSQAIQVGKALQDKSLATGLRRVGINIDLDAVKQMTTQQYQQYVLKELESEFGGAAQASVNPVKQMKNSMEDSFVEMGKNLTPLFHKLSSLLLGFVNTISSVVGWFTHWFDVTTNVGHALKELEVATAQYTQEMEKLDKIDNLIARYEELSAKTQLTTKEQKELELVTQRLAKKIPGASKGWNAYGKSIGIVTEEAKKYQKAQKQIAQSKLEAQVAKTLQEAGKALSNYDIIQGMKKGKSIGPGVTYQELLKDDPEMVAKIHTEMQKLSKDYESIENAILSVDNVSDNYYKTLHKIAKMSGRTSSSFAHFRTELESLKFAFKELSNAGLKGWEKLSQRQQQALSRYMDRVAVELRIQGRSEKAIRKHMQKHLNQMLVNRKSKASRNSATNSKGEGLYNKLQALKNQLDELSRTKIEVEISKQTKQFVDQFERLTAKDKKLIIDATLESSASGFAKATELIRKRYGENKVLFNKVAELWTQIEEVQSNLQDKAIKEAKSNYQTFMNANNDLYKDFANINKERKQALENLIQWEANERRKAQTNLFGKERKERLKQLEEEFNKRERAVKRMSNLQKAEAVTNKTTGYLGSVKSAIGSFREGGASGIISGIGELGGNIPVVGGMVKKAFGAVGSLVNMFSSEAETSEERWQRLFEKMKGAIDYQLWQQQEVLRVMKRQQEVTNFIDKLYNKDSLAGKLKLQELEYAKAEAENYQVGDTTLGSMTDEQILATYKEKKGEQARLEEIQAEAQFWYSQLRGSISSYKDWGDWGKTKYKVNDRNAYYKWREKLGELGVGTYSIGSIEDKYGSGREDISRNMRSFEQAMRSALGTKTNLLATLESYADVQNQIAQIRQDETSEMEKQLNIQNRLNEGLKDRLRALNNASVNSLLDKFTQVEYQMSIGALTKHEGNLQRRTIESQLINLMNSLGETGLKQELTLARADLLQAMNSGTFDALAGKGEVVEFHTGGLVSEDGLARLAKNEYVLRPEQYQGLRHLSGLARAVGNSSTNSHINNVTFYNTVRDDTDINKIEKQILKVIRDTEDRTGRKVLR